MKHKQQRTKLQDTHISHKLFLESLVAFPELLGHQLELVTLTPALVHLLLQDHQCFVLALQLPPANLELKYSNQ